MDFNLNQPFYDPSMVNYPQTEFYPPFPQYMYSNGIQKQRQPSFPLNLPSLHLPAILLFAVSWIMHTIATFIPYWSNYVGASGSRAGLWTADNVNFTSVQNFYVLEPTFPATSIVSVRFTSADTKGFLVTVQFLMTFNFVMMTILLFLLIFDYICSIRSNKPQSALIRQLNTSDTPLIYGLLLYFLYVFTVFEFAGWITYVASRHDNNWRMNGSFALAIIVSVFLILVFVMYVIEFFKVFTKNRSKWEYWYGPYVEWAFFVHLSALLLLLTVICCPEWGYINDSTFSIVAEIGLFKQCFLSPIYKKTLSSTFCTLSNSRSNQSWVNAVQAFMLMAFIFGMFFLIVMIVFRKEFRHNQGSYHSDRFNQPIFTFVIAGLIIFFCFIFSLIGVSVFGAKVFPNSVTVNWAYILAVFAMVLFLIAGILLIFDGIHSRKQVSAATSSSAQKFFFPEPLNNRVVAMQPLIKPEPAWQPETMIPPMIPLQPWQMGPTPWQPMTSYNFPQQQQLLPPPPPPPMYPGSFFPPQQMMMMPTNYGMEQYSPAPIAQAALSNYFRQMANNPQLSSPSPSPYNQGLINYSGGGNPFVYPYNQNYAANDTNLNELLRVQLVQQQRLNYNHERLLERYSRLRTPRVAQFSSFGTSSLPGRNYDQYLQGMRGDDSSLYGNSLVAQSRAGIGSSDETYRWMGNDEYYEPLPRYVSSFMQHSRNDPMPFVRAEKFEPVNIYDHPIFGPTPAYIRPIFKKTKVSKTKKDKETKSNHEEEKRKILITIDDEHDNEITNSKPLGYVSNENRKTNNEHIIPVDLHLFNLYNQRLNGDIQGYGQSLYVPSGHDDRPRSYLSNIESILDNKSHKSPSSEHQYNKLHFSDILNNDNDDDVSGNALERVNPDTSLQTKNNSISLISSAPFTTDIALPTSIASTLSTKNSSAVNNTGGLIASLSSNTTNPLMPHKPESISSSNSIVPYQTLSSPYDVLSTVIPKLDSTQQSTKSKENNTSLTEENSISSSKNDHEKKNETSTTVDDNSSSSVD